MEFNPEQNRERVRKEIDDELFVETHHDALREFQSMEDEELSQVVRILGDEEVAAIFRSLPEEAQRTLIGRIPASRFLLPGGQSRISCVMPYNEHYRSVRSAFECSQDSDHVFCVDHALALKKCPIDGASLTLR